jgi:acyl-CoA synthetase (AMP-forming)/AMP-acid ligase II
MTSVTEVFTPQQRGMRGLPRQTIWQALERVIADHGPGHVLFRFPDEDLVLTATGLRDAARRLARGLLARGVDAGDTVAVWAPGRAIWPLVSVAATAIGARVCGLNTRYRSSELEHVVRVVRPRLALIATDFLGIDGAGLIGAAARVVGSEGLLDALVGCAPGSGFGPAADGLSGLLAAGDATGEAELDRRLTRTSPGDAAFVQFTSGSTGNPKGVLISHDAGLRTGHYAAECQRLTPDDTMLSALPFFHIGGSLCTGLAALTSGTTMVIPERFDARTALDLIASLRITAFQGHGTLWKMLLSAQREHPVDLSSLRKGWASGDRPMMDAIRTELGVVDLTVVYGSSEGGTVAGSVPEDDLDGRVGTLGKPVPEAEVTIHDPETGAALPDGTTGEMWVRGPSAMLGYLPGTPGSRSYDGTVHTGDLGWYDEQGFLHFAGRVDDRLKPGGENVSVIEIEQFILSDPRIAQVAVVGAPDERLGDVPVAVVEPRPGEAVDPEQIIAWCRQTMANFKVPRHVRVVERIPTLDMGKVDRRRVRSEMLAYLAERGDA